MNYRGIYDNIISAAKVRDSINEYYETHHILPRCMGGTDNSDNLVKLTYREHYIAHLLLWKMETGQNKHKMAKAIMLFKDVAKKQSLI